MNIKTQLKIIWCLIILLIVLYYFINERTIGCKEITAINYNPKVNTHNIETCIFPTVGCTDKNAVNYNKWANTSCVEDCKGNTKSICDRTVKCLDVSNNRCKYPIKGCARNWINKDTNATIDDNSCMTIEQLLNRITILSGGNCLDCSNKVYIKIDDEYIINGGENGINVVIIDREIELETYKIKIKQTKSFDTATDIQQSTKFINFINDNVLENDIVLIAVKADAIGQDKNKLNQIITTEAQQILKKLGALKYEFIPNSSYILIGTLKKDIYYESTNGLKDSYFPLLNLINIGCINHTATEYMKNIIKIKLDTEHTKMLSNDITTDKHFIWKCALEVHSKGSNIFYIKNGECYMVLDKENKTNNFKYSKMNNALYMNNLFTTGIWGDIFQTIPQSYISNDICNINTILNTTGNSTSENYYIIADAYYSSNYSKKFGNLNTYIYSGINMTGIETVFDIGIQESIKILSNSANAKLNSGFEIVPINSVNVPVYKNVIIFKTYYTDKTLNNIDIPDYYLLKGPNNKEIANNISYKAYNNINEIYTNNIKYLLINNAQYVVNIYEKPKFDGLVIGLGFGKYIIPSIYTKPYAQKIIRLIDKLFLDFNLDKVKYNYKTIISDINLLLPITMSTLKAKLLSLIQQKDSETIIDKYLTYIDGMPIGSLINNITGDKIIVRFYGDIEFKQLIYTQMLNSSIINNSIEDVSENFNNKPACKGVIINRIQYMTLYNTNCLLDVYKTLTYNKLLNDKTLYTKSMFLDELYNATLNKFSTNWNPQIGIQINEVEKITLVSIDIKDKINITYVPDNKKTINNIIMIPTIMNELNNLKVNMILTINSKLGRTNQQYLFMRNIDDNNINYYANYKTIYLTAGNWKIKFEHNNVKQYSILEVPEIDIINEQYDYCIFDTKQQTVIDYIGTLEMNKRDNFDKHIFLKKLIKKRDNKEIEKLYGEYNYKTNTWLIHMVDNNIITNIVDLQRLF